jgi:putative nucleotidyltransferase with HDIG domain
MAATTLTANLLQLPITGAAARQALWDAGLAAAAGLLVAGVTLFVLPLLERAFDIITGMTLVELRDPKQPLLRRLQQAAPGTYNHSLNLGSLAEAAAEEIGADGLLAYVGALYHDIGKMNKPEYFVENQGGGPNRHDKLTPAMSLLVVVGHVKDGVEMARAYALPMSIQHFIESHHGTTLVEYFYHRARKRAMDAAESQGLSEDDVHVPDEYEYRYPGPRPQTKEAAILMVADAVESAARALDDPTPARLESLVQSIANKRLLDGQFEDCDISLRDLHRITESVSRTLAGIHHSRIDYPEPTQIEPKTASIKAD